MLYDGPTGFQDYYKPDNTVEGLTLSLQNGVLALNINHGVRYVTIPPDETKQRILYISTSTGGAVFKFISGINQHDPAIQKTMHVPQTVTLSSTTNNGEIILEPMLTYVLSITAPDTGSPIGLIGFNPKVKTVSWIVNETVPSNALEFDYVDAVDGTGFKTAMVAVAHLNVYASVEFGTTVTGDVTSAINSFTRLKTDLKVDVPQILSTSQLFASTTSISIDDSSDLSLFYLSTTTSSALKTDEKLKVTVTATTSTSLADLSVTLNTENTPPILLVKTSSGRLFGTKSLKVLIDKPVASTVSNKYRFDLLILQSDVPNQWQNGNINANTTAAIGVPFALIQGEVTADANQTYTFKPTVRDKIYSITVKTIGRALVTYGSANNTFVLENLTSIDVPQNMTNNLAVLISKVAVTTANKGMIFYYCTKSSLVHFAYGVGTVNEASSEFTAPTAALTPGTIKDQDCVEDGLNLSASLYNEFKAAKSLMLFGPVTAQIANAFIGILPEIKSTDPNVTTHTFKIDDAPDYDASGAVDAGKEMATRFPQKHGIQCHKCGTATSLTMAKVCRIQPITSDITGASKTLDATKFTVILIQFNNKLSGDVTGFADIEAKLNDPVNRVYTKVLDEDHAFESATGTFCTLKTTKKNGAKVPDDNKHGYELGTVEVTPPSLTSANLTQANMNLNNSAGVAVGLNSVVIHKGETADILVGANSLALSVTMAGIPPENVLTYVGGNHWKSINICPNTTQKFACDTIGKNNYLGGFPLALVPEDATHLSILAIGDGTVAISDVFKIISDSIVGQTLTMKNRSGLSSDNQVSLATGKLGYLINVTYKENGDLRQKVSAEYNTAYAQVYRQRVYKRDLTSTAKTLVGVMTGIGAMNKEVHYELTENAKFLVVDEPIPGGDLSSPTNVGQFLQLNPTKPVYLFPALTVDDQVTSSSTWQKASQGGKIGPKQTKYYSFRSTADGVLVGSVLMRLAVTGTVLLDPKLLKLKVKCEAVISPAKTRLSAAELATGFEAIPEADLQIDEKKKFVAVPADKLKKNDNHCFVSVENSGYVEADLEALDVKVVLGERAIDIFPESETNQVTKTLSVQLSEEETLNAYIKADDQTRRFTVQVTLPNDTTKLLIQDKTATTSTDFTGMNTVSINSEKKSDVVKLVDTEDGQFYLLKVNLPKATAEDSTNSAETVTIEIKQAIKRLITDAESKSIVEDSTTAGIEVTHTVAASETDEFVLYELELYRVRKLQITSGVFTQGLTGQYQYAEKGKLQIEQGTQIPSKQSPVILEANINLLTQESKYANLLLKLSNTATSGDIVFTFKFTKNTVVEVTASTTALTSQEVKGILAEPVAIVENQDFVKDDVVLFRLPNDAKYKDRIFEGRLLDAKDTQNNFAIRFNFEAPNEANKFATKKAVPVTFTSDKVFRIFMPDIGDATALLISGRYTGSGSGKIAGYVMELDLTQTSKLYGIDTSTDEAKKLLGISDGTSSKQQITGKFDALKLTPSAKAYTPVAPQDISNNKMNTYVAGNDGQSHEVTVYASTEDNIVARKLPDVTVKRSYTVTSGKQLDISTTTTNGVITLNAGTEVTYIVDGSSSNAGTGQVIINRTNFTTNGGGATFNFIESSKLKEQQRAHYDSLKSQLRQNQAPNTTAATTKQVVIETKISSSSTQPMNVVQGAYSLGSGNASSDSSSSSSQLGLIIGVSVGAVVAVGIIVFLVIFFYRKSKKKSSQVQVEN